MGLGMFIGGTKTGQKMAAYVIAWYILWMVRMFREEIYQWATNETTNRRQITLVHMEKENTKITLEEPSLSNELKKEMG